MTVAIAVLTLDGIAVATDSRTTQGTPPHVVSDETRKLYAFENVLVATYGLARLSDRTIADHWADFLNEAECDGSPRAVADALAEFVGRRLDRHIADDRTGRRGDQLGFLVAGYEGTTAIAFELMLPRRAPVRIRTGSGCVWRGQTNVIDRLVKGVDVAGLREALAGRTDISQSIMQLKPLEYTVPCSEMTLRDAVDFTVLAIRTTIDVQRLTRDPAAPGSCPTVGGEIVIATVEPTGLTWVRGGP